MKIKIIIFSLLLLFFYNPQSNAEECKTWDLNKIFYDEYEPDVVWVENGKTKNITWTTDSLVINDEPVTRPFTKQETEWAILAFKSWDEALDSISFTKINSQVADISIGWTKLNYPNAAGFWNSWKIGSIRVKATIKLKDSLEYLKQKDEFIHVVQHEVGNVLGLGDISEELSKTFKSAQQESWIKPYGTIPLSDNDISMIRQKYGESTCPSSWKTLGQIAAEESLKNANKQVHIFQEEIKLYMLESIKTKENVRLLKDDLILALGKSATNEGLYNSAQLEVSNLQKQINILNTSIKLLELENKNLKTKIFNICKKNKQCNKK